MHGVRIFVTGLFCTLLLAACSLSSSDEEPQIIYITATPNEAGGPPLLSATQPPPPPTRADLSPVPDNLPQPTADPPRYQINPQQQGQEHIVQANDTLYGIALAYGVSLDSLLAANQFEDPNALFIGQVVQLPDLPTEQTPNLKIIPDARLVRGPGSSAFDAAAFIAAQPGYIKNVTDEVETRQADGSTIEETLNAAQIVERVALEYSVDPRLLLTLLEYRARWLSDPSPRVRDYPMISEEDSAGVDREGLYRQLTWTANILNFGYYGWKYRGWTTLEFTDEDTNTRLLYHPELNAGTVGVQYLLAQNTTYAQWQRDVSRDGFYALYFAYFGNPFVNVVDPIVPPNLQQPELTLPFAQGETWFYTGGWHGGWNTGSAWAAVDFAPPDEPQAGVTCYTSEFPVLAVAPGLVVRSEAGAVMLDLDRDGDEATGWTIFYLHLAETNRIPEGAEVQTGDVIGYASCEGGFSTATHLHIARRYNGEWITADCAECSSQDQRPNFNMSGWEVIGIPNQEYQGFLQRQSERRVAEQGRLTPDNRVSW